MTNVERGLRLLKNLQAFEVFVERSDGYGKDFHLGIVRERGQRGRGKPWAVDLGAANVTHTKYIDVTGRGRTLDSAINDAIRQYDRAGGEDDPP